MNKKDLIKLLNKKTGKIKVIRKNYWPMIDYDKNQFDIPDYILEIIVVIQGFWWYNSYEFEITKEVEIQKTTVISHLKKFQRTSEDTLIDIIKGIEFYIKNMNLIFNHTPIPSRLIRISSLYDLDIHQFSTLQEFIIFLVINIHSSSNYFWKQNYYKAIFDTSEMQVIHNNTYPQLKIYNGLSYFIWKIDWAEIILKITPWYSPCGLMYMFWLEGAIDNYFFFISVYFENKDTAVLSCIQYNFVNIWKNKENKIELYDETEKSWINILELNGKDELKFREKLRDFFQKNPTEAFIQICIENLKKNWLKYIQIINPIENKWLMEHNQERNKDSLIKSWENLYTKPWLNIGWKCIKNWRIIF